MRRMSVLHQNSGGIGKSIPSALEISLDPRDFPRASKHCLMLMMRIYETKMMIMLKILHGDLGENHQYESIVTINSNLMMMKVVLMSCETKILSILLKRKVWHETLMPMMMMRANRDASSPLIASTLCKYNSPPTITEYASDWLRYKFCNVLPPSKVVEHCDASRWTFILAGCIFPINGGWENDSITLYADEY